MRVANAIDDHGTELPPAIRRAIIDAMLELALVLPRLEPLGSPHEGYAIVLEELDELWEHVRADTGRSMMARTEAIQVAVTALRYAADLTETVDT